MTTSTDTDAPMSDDTVTFSAQQWAEILEVLSNLPFSGRTSLPFSALSAGGGDVLVPWLQALGAAQNTAFRETLDKLATIRTVVTSLTTEPQSAGHHHH